MNHDGVIKRFHFKLEFESKFGENVKIYGDVDELSNWNWKRGVHLAYSHPYTWSMTIPIHTKGQPKETFKYKYYVVYNENTQIPRLEPAADHQIEYDGTDPSDITIFDKWGEGKCLKNIPIPEGYVNEYHGKLFSGPLPFSPRFDPYDRAFGEYKEHKIDVVVCLAYLDECREKSRVRPSILDMYGAHGYAVIYYPIDDFGTPRDHQLASFKSLLSSIASLLKKGNNIVVHCHAGIGRTGLTLTCLLKQYMNFTADDAIHYIRSYIRGAVESNEQYEYAVTWEK